MKLHLKIESLFDIMPEMELLTEQHYQEITLYKDKVKLNPDWSSYKKLEENNQFFLFTARVDGELVGYSAFFLKPHIHYKDMLVGSNDVLFLKKEHRSGLTGIKLLRYSEQKMKEFGANKITWHVKYSNDFRPILHRMGYADEDVIVGKMLK
jgi:hypothetical protein